MIDRINKLRSLLLEKTSAFLITSDVNRLYYTGFSSSAGVVYVSQNSAVLLVDFRYAEAAISKVDGCISVVCYKKLNDSINELISKENISSLIVEDDDVTVSKLNSLNKELDAEIITDFSLSDKILDFRKVKSEAEVDKIVTAQKITEKSFLQVLNNIAVGVTERQLAVELEYLMRQNGAQRIAFDIIAISGQNTSLPHGVPSDRALCEGDFITFDIGAVYDGYHSDMTRTVALKYATDEMQSVYDVVLNAHYKARDAIVCGNSCADVDLSAREYIESKGYGEYFGHTTGHGVGLEIHEKPTVYKTNNDILVPGMVITDEPGIYLPGKFGVRIEDMYLVTEDGYRDLASIDKELLIL